MENNGDVWTSMYCHNSLLSRRHASSVSVVGEASNSFQISNGVNQGCVLAPTLFSIMFSGVFKVVFQDNTDSIAIDWRTDGGGLFTLQDSGLKQKCITTLFEISYLQTTLH